jgi:hypothetical protein
MGSIPWAWAPIAGETLGQEMQGTVRLAGTEVKTKEIQAGYPLEGREVKRSGHIQELRRSRAITLGGLF